MPHSVIMFLVLVAVLVFLVAGTVKIVKSKGKFVMFPGLIWEQVQETWASLLRTGPGKYEPLQVEESRKLTQREVANNLILTNGRKEPVAEGSYVFARRGF